MCTRINMDKLVNELRNTEQAILTAFSSELPMLYERREYLLGLLQASSEKPLAKVA